MRSVMKSQKARGVQFLQARYNNVPPVAFWRMPNDEALGARDVPKYGFPCFARPCPTAPRHGFVDSRVVNNAEEARDVYAEALLADAQAELMLMALIDADRSAVLTPHWAAIGNGHDGATAGKAGTIAVQLLHTAIPNDAALVPDGQVPYLELVYGTYSKRDASQVYASRRDAWLVQLRSGPMIGGQGAGNYIPRTTVVRQIVDAHALDALTLEATLNDADANGALEGLVIWQANGNPCSHAACHARLHVLPIVFDVDAPTIGATLEQTSEAEQPMNERAMRAAVRAAGAARYTLMDSMPSSILWAIHQAPALARSAEGAAFVAQACVNLWRYAATACIGEARHSHFTHEGKRRRRSRVRARHTIYATALTKHATDAYLRSRTTMALAAFSLADNFAGGYGGAAWEGCTRAALALYDALAALTRHKGTAADVIIAAHAVVNSAHNNGPFLNKFIGSESFDNAAHGDVAQATRALEELHVHATTPRATEGAPWPIRKHKKPKALNIADVQWNLRQEGTALHAQAYVGGKGAKYLSATIPVGMLPPNEIASVILCAAFAFAGRPSHAGSSSTYWEARGVLSAATLAVLFPTIGAA